MLNFLVNFLSAVVISIGACFLSIRLARKFNLIDHPGKTQHKQHSRPTPLAGGMAILIALAVAIIFHHDWISSKFFGVFASAIIVFVFGIWDDAEVLPFWVKLIGQLLAGLVLIYSGISVHIVKAVGWEWLNWGITLFWVIGIINGCNFVDSFDNLSIGVGMTMLVSLLIGTKIYGQGDLVQLITILVGILLVLYFFNSSPALLFLGDSGAQLLGIFTAAIAIMYTPKGVSPTVSWFTPILIAGIPIFDTSLVVYSRIRRNKHVYLAGLDHTWHRLVALGMAGHTAVHLIHLVSLILGCLALILLDVPGLYATLIFLGVLAVGFGLIIFMDARKRWE